MGLPDYLIKASELSSRAGRETTIQRKEKGIGGTGEQNPIEVIIAAGAAARHAVQNWPGRGNLPVVEILHPSARDEAALVASWNDGLATLQNMLTPDEDGQPDPTPYGPTFTPQDHAPIPRFDLPFGLPDWHGRGDHGKRDGPKKIIWTAP